VEVGNAGNSPRVLTLKQWPMVEMMTKVRTIGVSGNVGKIDMLRRGNWITREEGTQRRLLLRTAGNLEGVQGIIHGVLSAQSGLGNKLFSYEITTLFFLSACMTDNVNLSISLGLDPADIGGKIVIVT